MNVITLPIDDDQIRFNDIIGTMQLICLITNDIPTTPVPSHIVQLADRFRKHLASVSSGVSQVNVPKGHTAPKSYLTRMSPTAILDFASAGIFLYFAKLGSPMAGAKTSGLGNDLIAVLQALKNNDKVRGSKLITIRGQAAEKFMKGYTSFIDMYLKDLNLSITDKLSKLLDKFGSSLKTDNGVKPTDMVKYFSQVSQAMSLLKYPNDSDKVRKTDILFAVRDPDGNMYPIHVPSFDYHKLVKSYDNDLKLRAAHVDQFSFRDYFKED